MGLSGSRKPPTVASLGMRETSRGMLRYRCGSPPDDHTECSSLGLRRVKVFVQWGGRRRLGGVVEFCGEGGEAGQGRIAARQVSHEHDHADAIQRVYPRVHAEHRNLVDALSFPASRAVLRQALAIAGGSSVRGIHAHP